MFLSVDNGAGGLDWVTFPTSRSLSGMGSSGSSILVVKEVLGFGIWDDFWLRCFHRSRECSLVLRRGVDGLTEVFRFVSECVIFLYSISSTRCIHLKLVLTTLLNQVWNDLIWMGCNPGRSRFLSFLSRWMNSFSPDERSSRKATSTFSEEAGLDLERDKGMIWLRWLGLAGSLLSDWKRRWDIDSNYSLRYNY